jgi:hypothetical protein
MKYFPNHPAVPAQIDKFVRDTADKVSDFEVPASSGHAQAKKPEIHVYTPSRLASLAHKRNIVKAPGIPSIRVSRYDTERSRLVGGLAVKALARVQKKIQATQPQDLLHPEYSACAKFINESLEPEPKTANAGYIPIALDTTVHHDMGGSHPLRMNPVFKDSNGTTIFASRPSLIPTPSCVGTTVATQTETPAKHAPGLVTDQKKNSGNIRVQKAKCSEEFLAKAPRCDTAKKVEEDIAVQTETMAAESDDEDLVLVDADVVEEAEWVVI